MKAKYKIGQFVEYTNTFRSYGIINGVLFTNSGIEYRVSGENETPDSFIKESDIENAYKPVTKRSVRSTVSKKKTRSKSSEATTHAQTN